MLALFIIGYASGYGFNLSDKSLYRTGIIEVQPNPPQSKIYVNGKYQGDGRIRLSLAPGRYRIKVTCELYNEYEKQVDLKKGQAIVLNQVQLFLGEPKVEKFDQGQLKGELEQLTESDGLSSQNSEIYQGDNLITRFSSDVYGLSWFPNRSMISYTQNNRLKLISIDGDYIVNLLDKDSKSPAVYINSGKFVIYKNAGDIYRAQII